MSKQSWDRAWAWEDFHGWRVTYQLDKNGYCHTSSKIFDSKLEAEQAALVDAREIINFREAHPPSGAPLPKPDQDLKEEEAQRALEAERRVQEETQRLVESAEEAARQILEMERKSK